MNAVDMHIELIYEVLKACCSFGLEVCLRKCMSIEQTILFLKFVLSRDEASVDPPSTSTPIHFDITGSLMGITSSLGFASHYRMYIKYIKDFTKIAQRLKLLTKS